MSQSRLIGKRDYFDQIAPRYNFVRGTEILSSLVDSITFVNYGGQQVLDIATGTGLFSVPLAESGFRIIGLDQNPRMLAQAIRTARQRNCNFFGVLGLAESLPFPKRSFSLILSTNAIHHFSLRDHISEVVRVLNPGGYYVIYSRFRNQNARSIFGQLFPHFVEKETRLYDPEVFENLENEFPQLALDSLEELTFEKVFSREHLLEEVQQRKYSTFAFYNESEFETSCLEFQSRLRRWENRTYASEIGRIVFRRR